MNQYASLKLNFKRHLLLSLFFNKSCGGWIPMKSFFNEEGEE